MIVLDTNVVSELMRETPEPAVLEWLDRQPPISVWTTAITVLEIRSGIERLAPGRRRDALARAFASLIEHDLSGRILAFDEHSAHATAAITARLYSTGCPSDLRDSMIAGIVAARRAQLATRHIRHFKQTDIDLVDPWS